MIEVALVPGDGIGPEVAEAVVQIFAAAQAPIAWVRLQAGEALIASYPSGLPDKTLSEIRRLGVALKGPTTTPSGKGHQSINVLMRKKLGLFANVRPAKSTAAIKTRFENIDLIVVRENVEDTYGGVEYLQSLSVAEGLKIASRLGAERCIRYAFELAKRENRRKVTCVHKANIHKFTDGLFLEVFQKLALEYPELESGDMLVDNLCMQLVSRPEKFDVLVMPNLFGDIVSDLCAGLIGGLGVAPAGNIGDGVAVFEAVHGSAPDIANKGLANPTALLLSGLMLLRHLGLTLCAARIQSALEETLEAGQSTRDLGGTLSTDDFTRAVISRIHPPGKNEHAAAQTAKTKLTPLTQAIVPAKAVELIGLDISISSLNIPRAPERLGSLRLVATINRGVAVHANTTETTDAFCLRYLSDRPIDEVAVRAALGELEQSGFVWTQVRKLYLLDGVKSFTTVA